MLEQIDTMTQELAEAIPSSLDREISLSDNALTVLGKRYLLRGSDGEPVETHTFSADQLMPVIAALANATELTPCRNPLRLIPPAKC